MVAWQFIIGGCYNPKVPKNLVKNLIVSWWHAININDCNWKLSVTAEFNEVENDNELKIQEIVPCDMTTKDHKNPIPIENCIILAI